MKLKNLFLNLILLDLILVVLFAGHLAIDSILNDKPIALPLNYGAVASNEQALANPSYNPVIQQLSQEAVGVPRATVTSNDNNDYESSNDDDSRPRTRSSRNSNSNSNSLFDLQGYVPTLPIPNNPQPFTYTKTASRVLQRLNEEGNARVIVDLSDPSKKEQVLGILNNFDKKVDMKNGFAGYIDIDDLQALENSPIVDFIYEDRPLHIANAESFPLIQADKAASVTYNNFADLTGAGQTVCLIDTGIDYRHDDLGNCTYDDYINDNCDKFADNGWDFYNTDNDPDDDNGHGTAMAGLIAGNGAGYQGLVPEAKIIAVKISDSTGGSWSSLVDEGVNWCVDNATKFNITVISIGFSTAGTTNNPSICVGPMADEINRAVGDGITVFAPTGNSEVIDGISSPACIPNATAVSAVGDGSNGYTADVIHSFPLDGQGPNRYPGMTDLMAPGLSIDTLDLESFGGYAFGGIGTSYASAHAVGSAMLLKEYYQERYSYDLTPAEIRNILSITGKPIYDINTSAYYPRIDVLAAIHYEEWAPTVNLESPADAATENEGVVSFTYNAADAEHSIDNCTLYIDGQENLTHYYKGSYAKIDTCSEQWMIPCWLSSEGDNTFNTCDAGYSSTGGLGRGGVDEVLINDSYVLDGEDIEVTCKFNLRSKSPVDGGIFYYDGSSWNEIWHQNLPVMDGVYEVKATVNANANIGQHWVRCSYLYDPNNITGYCADEASGDYHHDNDDIYFYVTDDTERAKDREEGMSYSFDVPLSATSYDWNVQCYDDSTIPNEGVSEIRTINVQSPDTTPPATITGLTSISKSTDYVYWEWTNPIDGDFSENIVYIDSVNEINTSNSYYNATGLFDDTAYTITVHTKDTNGNVNDTDVNDTVTTLGGDTTPPVISNVRNTSVTNQTVIIEWDTDEMSNSSINYGITPALGTISETNVYTTAHVRPLSSLQANTTYYYNVTSCDPSGNCATDGPYSFKTQENIPPAPGGYLQVLSQTPDTDVTKDDFFSFSIDVKCNNGTCSNVVLTLDPWEDYNFTEEEIALAQEELNKIKKDIEDNNLDWNADLTPAFVDYVRRDRKGEIVYVEPIGEEELAGSPITQEDEKILPYYFDWRNAYGENWVTSAKNQGACSSCWAFGAVGVAEAALNIYNRWPSLMLNLSEQDIVSCSGAGDCGSGGSDNNALAYIRDTGIVNESCFPYTASDAPCGNKCADGKQYHIQDKLTIVEGADGVDKEAAIKALLKYGPSTAQINVYTDFFSYVSGIYEPSTTNTIGAHIINVIGYNETGDYFIVKNSYGTGWGMNGSGYIKSWVILNDSTIFNRLRFATGADQLNNKGVIPMNSGTPFYTITQNPYDCGNMNEGETCSVAWQVNATGFHLSDWDFFVIIESDAENSTSQNSTITIIGDYIPVIESMECESKGTWKNCSLIESGTDLTRIRVNVTDENSNIQNVGVRLKEDGIIIAEGSGAYSSGFYVYDHADKPMDSNKDYKIEVDVSDETYSINGFVSFKPTIVCIEDWQLQYDACQTNDQQLKYYTDNNVCGTTNDLPADNGTYVSCNYCSEDIQGPFTTACTIFDNQTQYYTDNNYAACCAVTGLTSDCSIDNGTYDNQTLVCDCCTPNWVEVNTSCQQDDTITGYYEDSNNCYAQTGLASDNNPPANNTYTCDYCTPNLINTSWTAWTNISCLPDDTMNQTRNRTQYDSNYCGEVSNTTFVEYRATEFCDYCTHNLVNTSWSSWYDITLCQTDDTIEQERNRTQYDSNSCGEVSNQTFFEYQDIACDYCTPDWQPYNTSCQPDDTLTQCYLDSNDCYAATGLSSDNNPPANQTFSCNYANDAPVLDPISNIVVDENDLVQITPSATDIDGDTLTYSFESPLNSSGEWQTTYADSGSYDVNVTVDDGNGGIDWQLVNILVNDVLLPDLRISSSKVLTPTPAAGSWTTFQIVLENIGDVIAGNIYWILDTDSAEDNPSFGPFDLDPGKTVDIYPVVKYTSAGTYAPVFTVDYNNTIQEYDETNNEQTISLVMS